MSRKLNKEIERLSAIASKLDPTDSEYRKVVEALEILYRIRGEHSSFLPFRIPPEIVAAGTNILGILLVLNYENLNVITSKAFSQIGKLRL
jgi:hypothetical protein